MSLSDLLAGGNIGLILVLTLIQIAPVKINPWSTIGKFLRNALNKDVLEEIEKQGEVLKQHGEAIAKQNEDINAMRYENEKNKAEESRYRIIRFDDEVRLSQKHSREHFNQIIDDIDEYEKFCKQHTDFQNNKAVMACAHIKNIYNSLDSEDFL